MTFEDLAMEVGHRPFVPFRIYLTDGGTFDIRHPELFMLGRRSVNIGIARLPDQTFYDRWTVVDLMHIVRIENLPPETPLNGEPATGTAGG